jgi:hypothetical protein
LKILSEAQPILTGKKPGETILAGAAYENGRILVASHDCYFDWFNERNDRNIVKLMNNIKYWLTGDDRVRNDEIADITEVNRFNDYKIIKWSFEQSLSRQKQQDLIRFIENGGKKIFLLKMINYLKNLKKKLFKVDYFVPVQFGMFNQKHLPKN